MVRIKNMNNREAIKGILLVIVSMVLLFVSNHIYGSLCGQILESEVITGAVASILSYLTSALCVYAVHKRFSSPLFKFSRSCKLETTIYELLALLLVGGFFSFLMVILMRFIDNEHITAGNNMVNYTGLTLIEILMLIIAVAIVAPIVEEILFRGVLLGALRKVIDIRVAIILSSVVFGLLHRTSVMMVIAATVSGIVLACIYLYHENLINSIIVHAIFNLLATFSAIRPRFPVEISDLLRNEEGPIVFLIGFGLIIYFVFLGRYIIGRLKGTTEEVDECNVVSDIEQPLWQRLLGVELVDE